MNFTKPKFWDLKKPHFLAIILLPVSIVFQFIFWITKSLKRPKKFNVPIICIGNIYIGGTGKTPLSREIFNILNSLNKNPAFIKKSYPYLNDEIKMLENSGKVFVSENRSSSIYSLIENNYNVAILDDGFQDFSIESDFSILCFNSKQLIGNGLVIPSGPLREKISSIKRADCIFINGEKNIEFEKKLKKVKSDIEIFYTNYKIKNSEKLIDKKIIAFAGIGNPSNFFELLIDNNIKVKKTISFPDHHDYSEKDFDSITKNEENTNFLTTEKDYFRMNNKMKNKISYVEVDLEIENKETFINLLKKRL